MWQNFLPHFPKGSRYTLGSKIDDIFLSAIEYCFLASYSPLGEKLPILDRAISRTDLIKLFLTLAWESKYLDTNKYTQLSLHLSEVGRMLGGWRKQIETKTLELFAREKPKK